MQRSLMASLQTQNNPVKASVWPLMKSNVCVIVCFYHRTKLLAFPKNLARKNNLRILDGFKTNAATPSKQLAALYPNGLSVWLWGEKLFER